MFLAMAMKGRPSYLSSLRRLLYAARTSVASGRMTRPLSWERLPAGGRILLGLAEPVGGGIDRILSARDGC